MPHGPEQVQGPGVRDLIFYKWYILTVPLPPLHLFVEIAVDVFSDPFQPNTEFLFYKLTFQFSVLLVFVQCCTGVVLCRGSHVAVPEQLLAPFYKVVVN